MAQMKVSKSDCSSSSTRVGSRPLIGDVLVPNEPTAALLSDDKRGVRSAVDDSPVRQTLALPCMELVHDCDVWSQKDEFRRRLVKYSRLLEPGIRVQALQKAPTRRRSSG